MTTRQALEQQIRQERSAVLIVNAFSRRGAKSFTQARELLAQSGITLAATYPLQDPNRLPQIIQEVVAQGHKLVIVGGGDGTISSVVEYFAYRDVVLGILPLGTGNSFARTLGIPLTLQGAIDVIGRGKVVEVDLGKVNDDYFANVITIGMSGDVALTISAKSKRYLGPLAYGLGMLRYFYSHRPFQCHLTLPDRSYEIQTHQVIIENGSLFGLTPFTPRTLLEDQRLFVLATNTASRWRTLRVWASFFFGRPRTFPEAICLSTQEILIEADPPQWVDVDGEITSRAPARISLAPGALKVIAPQSFPDVATETHAVR